MLYDGEEEYAAGFGVTSAENPLEVTPETLFQTGSTTKTLTGPPIMARMLSMSPNPDCPDKNPVLYREPGKRGKHPLYCPNPDGGQSRCRMRANYLNNTKPKRRKARTSN